MAEHTLSEEQAAEFLEVFQKFDKSNEKKVSTTDMAAMMEAFGVTLSDKEYTDMLEALDPDGTGDITEARFMSLMGKKLGESEHDKDIKQAFKVFDRKNNGSVATAELRHALRCLGAKMSQEDIDKLIADGDPRNTGTLSYEPFIKAMTS